MHFICRGKSSVLLCEFVDKSHVRHELGFFQRTHIEIFDFNCSPNSISVLPSLEVGCPQVNG